MGGEDCALSLLLAADKFLSSDLRYESVHSSIPKLNSGRVGCTVILSRSEGETTGKKAGELIDSAIQVRRRHRIRSSVNSCYSISAAKRCSYGSSASGYKIVISRALGMHGIYCTQPSGRYAPSCFGAINPIHPLRP